MAIESGKKIGAARPQLRDRYEHVNLVAGPLRDLAKLDDTATGNKIIPRLTFVNITLIIAGVRERGAALGLEFPRPMFPPLTDPEFERVKHDLRQRRELARAAR